MILLVSLCLLASTSADSMYRVTIDHPIQVMEGGSIEEALQLTKEWRDKVLLKNPHMIKVDYLLEKQSHDRYLLLVIYYYKDRNGAELASQMMGTLIQKAWPEEGARNAFFTRLQSYIVREEKKTHHFEVIP